MRNNNIRHIQRYIAPIMILCMLLADIQLILEYKGISTDDYYTYEAEDHDMSTFYADGQFTDRDDSDHEKVSDSTDTIDIPKSVVNILEISPAEGMGKMAYSVGGCEPLGYPEGGWSDNCGLTEKQWRAAYMDAAVNTCPGVGNQYYWNEKDSRAKIWDFPMNEGTVKAIGCKKDTYSGYYKKVPNGQGVYSICTSQEIEYETVNGVKVIKNVPMISKFASLANANYSNTGLNDYIWIDGSDSQSEHTTKEEMDNGGNIYIYDQYRTRYYNNEEFLTLLYSDEEGESGVAGTDGANGVYTMNGFEVTGKNTGNYDAIYGSDSATGWKQNNEVIVYSKTPATVTIEDIDNADLLIIDSGNSIYQEFYNTAYGTSYTLSKFSASNDITFEQVLDIYDHVVAKQDIAVVMGNNVAGDGDRSSNFGKLKFMLFGVENSNVKLKEGEDRVGTGREIFTDFIWKYIDAGNCYSHFKNDSGVYDCTLLNQSNNANGFMLDFGHSDGTRTADYTEIVTVSGSTDFGSLKIKNDFTVTTDYIRKHEDGGIVTIKGTDGNIITCTYSPGSSKEGTFSSWPTSVGQCWLLDQCQFSASDGSGGGNGVHPLFDYYADQGFTYNDGNGDKAHYANQSIYNDTNDLLAYGTGTAALVSGALASKKDAHHTTTLSSTKKKYYLSMNIINGDSTNGSGSNKIMYYNDYELNKTDSIPITFKYKTSEPVKEIILYKGTAENGVEIAKYTPKSDSITELQFSGTSSVTAVNLTKLDSETGLPQERVSGETTPIYTFEMTINDLVKKYYISGVNNRFTVKLINKYGKSITDSITVVKRDFFELE